MLFSDIKILDKDFNVQEHMYVKTTGERITYVGKERPYVSGDEEEYKGNCRFLMPAFYNTHCHVPMTLLRGYGEGLSLDKWYFEKVFPFEAGFDGESKYWGAKLGALELIKSGCVSVSDMYSCLPQYGQGLYELGMKANLSNGLLNFDENASFYDDNSYRDTAALLEWIKDHDDGRIRADASIHAEYTTKEKAVREACEFAKEHDMIMQVHISETKGEHEGCLERHGLTPLAYFKKMGIFSTPVIAAHCVWLSDEDIEIMASENAYMSHNVSSNLKLGSGIAPIKKYSDKGMRITIGTDGASSNNNLDMLEEIRTAALVSRGISIDANAVPVKDILKMATIEGAKAQGRSDCGSIEEGKKADLIVFDLDRPEMTPDYDTASNVVFSAGSGSICLTMCDGRILYRDGEILFGDETEIKAKAGESFKKVLENI